MRCGVALIIVAALTACDDRVENRFPDYAAIPVESGVWSWLPVFFPTSASEIEIAINLDINLFYADFSVTDSQDRDRFEAVLDEASEVNYADFIHRSWCKTGRTIWNSEAQARSFFIQKISAERYRITNDDEGFKCYPAPR